MNKKGLLSILLIILIFISGCGQTNKTNKPNEAKLVTDPYQKTEFLMGTVVTLKVYDEGKQDALDSAFDRIETLDKQITVNSDEPKSVINKVNKNAGIQPVKVPKDIYTLVEAGLNYSKKANGSYDITIGPLTNLWHIGFPDARKPKQTEIDSVLPLIDYKKLELNKTKQTVFLKEKGMQLDLGSIAKGFIADEVAKVLKKKDVTTAIIDLGGNIVVLGNNPSGDKWSVGIQDPYSERGNTIGKIAESNRSIVTSGIYERVLYVDDESYHHILNPKDGYPFRNDIAGVTIVSDKSIDGDGLSTSVFSKGIKDGLKFIEQFEGADAIFISLDKKVYITSGLKGNFELTNKDFTLEELPQSK